MNPRTKIILFLIILLSAFLHLYKISDPPETVFDEAYYASHASSFQNRAFFYDIHPPFGKMIYAGVLAIISPAHPLTQFLKVELDPETKKIDTNRLGHKYEDFPYLALRITNAIFGIALVFLVFLFMKNLGANDATSLLAAFFVSMENAILLDTRLIMLNGMFLTFGFLSLVLYSKLKARPIFAGIFFGLSVATKLSGIIFLVPAIVFERLYRGKKIKNLLIYIIAGGFIFLVILLSQNIFFSIDERIAKWSSLGANKENPLFPSISDPFPLGQIKATAYEIYYSSAGYLFTVKATSEADKEFGSKWYEWPIMKKTFLYYISNEGRDIYMIGNPVVWYWGTVAVVGTIFSLLFLSNEAKKILLVLLSGYIFSFVPLAFVDRFTFLNHYFPALLFSICLSAYLFDLLLEKVDQKKFPKLKLQAYLLAISLSTAGFIAAAQHTYLI